jgi:hypothetical protein
MTGESGDRGRASVYAAETAAFDGTDLEVVRTPGYIVGLIGRLAAGQWWPGPVVVAVEARGDAQSSSTHGPIPHRQAGAVSIRLAADQATVATAAHELAHALAGVDRGHDALFRRAYLDVVEVITNIDPHDRRGDLHRRQLAEAFSAHGLDVAERTWPRPDSAIAGPIEL